MFYNLIEMEFFEGKFWFYPGPVALETQSKLQDLEVEANSESSQVDRSKKNRSFLNSRS